MNVHKISQRQVRGIALKVLPTELVFQLEMTHEGHRSKRVKRQPLSLRIDEVTRMKATFVNEIRNDVEGISRVV